MKSVIAELKALVRYHEEQFRLAKRRQFSPSSEKNENYEQFALFFEVEATADSKESEPALEEITYIQCKW